MKIKYDRDFMEEIDYLNKGISLSNNLKMGTVIGTGTGVVANLFFTVEPESIEARAFLFSLFGVAAFIIWGITGTPFEFLFYRNQNKYYANERLKELSMDLKRLNVNTNVDLLKKSKLVKTKYKMVMSKHNIPVLKRERDINIIVKNNMGKEFEETLLEEHIVGNFWKDNYELSVKEPDKVVKLVKQKASV